MPSPQQNELIQFPKNKWSWVDELIVGDAHLFGVLKPPQFYFPCPVFISAGAATKTAIDKPAQIMNPTPEGVIAEVIDIAPPT
jgi:hypothetical protein